MYLLNPIVIRLRQKQVVLGYPFKYLSAVNGKAVEVVVNYENTKNFTGCDDTSPVNPSCGVKHEKGVAISYSEGFCCFCPESSKEKHIRGGQDCSIDVGGDLSEVDKQKYKASAHCLQYNDVWYTVSAIKEPAVMHETFLQVYNQRHLLNGSSVWVALTHDEEFELGTRNPYQYDDNKTILATYFTAKPKNSSLTVPIEGKRLLTPQPLPGVPLSKLPTAIKNGATDYLLFPQKLLNSYGSECDKAGVSFEGFAKQKDRCNLKKDTCLSNQPLDFWLADDEKRKSGAKGEYMLHNFGTPYKEPIFIDQITKEHFLALDYFEKHTTVLSVEVNADDIVVLAVGKAAQISKVITASFRTNIDFHVSLLNRGLTPAKFSVEAVKCGFGVPTSNNQTVLIAPQLMENVVVSTKPGDIELDENLFCTIQVSSPLYGIVATREVKIKPLDRCICNMHCKCVCLGDSLKCKPMSEKDYHAAGFVGDLPVLTAKPLHKSWFLKHPFLAFLMFILYFILFGFVKAIIGYTRFKIAKFGLEPFIYQPKKIDEYLEPELKNLEVMYDDEGYPINPDTKEPVRVINNRTLFVLNVFFCFVWPYHKIRQLSAEKCDGIMPFISNKSKIPEEDDQNISDAAQGKDAPESDAETSSLKSVDLHSDAADNKNSEKLKDAMTTQRMRIFTPDESAPGQRSSRLKSTTSDSILETPLSETDIELLSKEASMWQKGTHKVQAVTAKL